MRPNSIYLPIEAVADTVVNIVDTVENFADAVDSITDTVGNNSPAYQR